MPKPKGKQKEVRFEDINPNDVMTLTKFVKVEKIMSRGQHSVPQLDVIDVDSGARFSIHGQDLIEAAMSADSFLETKKVTKTAMAEILMSAWNRPFTVTFIKQDGGTRELRGRLSKPEPIMGRSHVEDLDKDNGVRLVDHRTIQELVVGGVQYKLK